MGGDYDYGHIPLEGALNNMRQYQVDKQYMPGGTYPQPARASRYVTQDVPVVDYRRNQVQGLNPSRTAEQNQVAQPDAGAYRFPSGSTRALTPATVTDVTRAGTTEHLQVPDYRRHPELNPRRRAEQYQVAPIDAGANRFPSGSTRALTPATVTDVTSTARDYGHAPLNENTMPNGFDPYRMPKRPI